MSRRTSGFTLRLDEKLCNTLVNSIRGIVWEADPASFRFSYVSPQAKRILGYPLRQWIEEEDFWRSHMHPLDVEWCSELCRNASARGEDHEFEYRMIAANGRIVWFHDIVTVVEDEAGVARLRRIIVDISEAKLAEFKSLQHAEEELYLAKACIDNAPIGFLRISLEGRILEANEFSCNSLEYSRDQLYSMTVFDFDPEFTAEMWSAHMERLRKEGSLNFETVHQGADGNRFPVEVSVALLELHGNGFLYSFERDISDRTKAEQAIREQEQLYRAMVDQAPDGVVLVDAQSLGFQEFNDVACTTLGYSREEFAALTVLDINAEFDTQRRLNLTRKFISQGHTVFETLHRHKDGSLRNARISQRIVRIGERNYFLCFWTDITESVRLHEELRLRDHYQRALLDNFPYGAWMTEAGRYLAANRKLAEYMGLKRWEDLEGRTNYDFLPQDLCDRIAGEDRKALISGKPKHVEEILPVQGEPHWFDVIFPVTIAGRRMVRSAASGISPNRKR